MSAKCSLGLEWGCIIRIYIKCHGPLEDGKHGEKLKDENGDLCLTRHCIFEEILLEYHGYYIFEVSHGFNIRGMENRLDRHV
ncbi:hypothetical protein GOP47_0023364 [Adiantum capillus-veneris]|uniref:Uncharacterized protein n=1 Tax=Adiantum capillus-veneris TaxID=13818 RepID=A0A9D4U3C9_ADICA|nr:hypothetical protein GOP47_0023364 [Adiantum capillus-veneris]